MTAFVERKPKRRCAMLLHMESQSLISGKVLNTLTERNLHARVAVVTDTRPNQKKNLSGLQKLLENEQIEEASTYAGCYVLIYILGTVLLTFFSGCTLVQGAFEFASSLGTVGLSIGVTNSNTSTICLLIEIVGMVLGRLEIFVIFKAILKR